MTERLRTWLGDTTGTFIETLDTLGVNIDNVRETRVVATRSVQDTASKYVAALQRGRDKASTAQAARALTNALLALAHSQTQLDRHLSEVEAALGVQREEVKEFKIQTLREITRLRSSAQTAVWQNPAAPLRVGTYLNDGDSNSD